MGPGHARRGMSGTGRLEQGGRKEVMPGMSLRNRTTSRSAHTAALDRRRGHSTVFDRGSGDPGHSTAFDRGSGDPGHAMAPSNAAHLRRRIPPMRSRDRPFAGMADNERVATRPPVPLALIHTCLVLGLILTGGCGRGEPAADDSGAAAEASPSSDRTAAAQPGGTVTGEAVELTPVEAEEEDPVIFRQTVEWARGQRLDTLETGPLMAALGRRFVGAPYLPGTLDPHGPERLVINLRSFDCVTYVESMLAIARVLRAGAATFDDFTRELRRIRYRDGIPPDYPARLHYFSDWIAANEAKGIVQSIAAGLGGVVDTEPIDFMSTHPGSYRQLADTANLRAIIEVEARLRARERVYIPEAGIADIASEIRDGDIIAATSTVAGLDIAHTGLALWHDGALHLMHAPLVGSAVEISVLPLADRILEIEGQDGIMVARPR